MGVYKKPEKRIHRGFVYLDDETVINSLSAMESGDIDKVVAKLSEAREGGVGAGLGFSGAKLEGGKKSTSGFEEEIVRTRTRFSAFELWYSQLVTSKALGKFDGWNETCLEDVRPGDTVEFRAECKIGSLQTVLRLFLWFASQAKDPNSQFAQKGDELKATKEAERNMRALMGELANSEVAAIAVPVGDPGPTVSMTLADRWVIGEIGRIDGEYRVVGQVERVLGEGDEWPSLRLTRDAPATPMELDVLREAVEKFVTPAETLGVTVSQLDASVSGPALLVTPIAIFR